MAKVESPVFDEGVGIFLSHSLALLNRVVPEKGARKEETEAALIAATTELEQLRRTTPAAEYMAMDQAARLLLQGVIDEYEAGAARG